MNEDSSFVVGNRVIGFDQPVFVVAEIGVNHDGSLKRAAELVQHAAEAGADAVKFQVFRAATLMHATASFASYQIDRVPETDPAAMLHRYELTAEELRKLTSLARRLGLVPLATPFSPADVQLIDALDLPAIKIASPDVVNRPLLECAAATGRPLFVSTGAATLDEIDAASGWLRAVNATFALLHCVSSYPVPTTQANLCWIAELAARYAVPAGYSDHTTELLTGACATSAGAVIIEKHLTYDRAAEGPDHAASTEPAAFADFVRLIRAAQRMRGRRGKHLLDIEQDVRTASRQSLVSARDLSPGQRIESQDLMIQRPGIGIEAARVSDAVGKRAARAIAAGTILQWEMLSDAA